MIRHLRFAATTATAATAAIATATTAATAAVDFRSIVEHPLTQSITQTTPLTTIDVTVRPRVHTCQYVNIQGSVR